MGHLSERVVEGMYETDESVGLNCRREFDEDVCPTNMEARVGQREERVGYDGGDTSVR